MCEAAAPRLGVAPFSSYVYINYTCSNSTYTISVSQQDSGTYSIYINSQFNSLNTNEKRQQGSVIDTIKYITCPRIQIRKVA